eukprot:761456-Hanusia_phi.AAC.1
MSSHHNHYHRHRRLCYQQHPDDLPERLTCIVSTEIPCTYGKERKLAANGTLLEEKPIRDPLT